MYRQDYDETMPFQVNGSLWTFRPTGHRVHGEPNQCNDIRYTTEAWRHNGTCNVLFYDGPVKSLKQGLHIQLRSISPPWTSRCSKGDTSNDGNEIPKPFTVAIAVVVFGAFLGGVWWRTGMGNARGSADAQKSGFHQ